MTLGLREGKKMPLTMSADQEGDVLLKLLEQLDSEPAKTTSV